MLWKMFNIDRKGLLSWLKENGWEGEVEIEGKRIIFIDDCGVQLARIQAKDCLEINHCWVNTAVY